MTFTVRELLRQAAMSGACLVGGRGGLDHPISWVHVVEVFDEPYFLTPDVLLLTTGYGFRDSENLQESVLAAAHRATIAGIVLKVGYELESVPPRLIALADRYSIPLLEVTQEVLFSGISKIVASRVLQADLDLVMRTQELFGRLMDSKLREPGFDSLTDLLAESLDMPAFVTDGSGRVISWNAPREAGGVELSKYDKRLKEAGGIEKHFAENTVVAVTGRGTAEPTLFLSPILYQGRAHGSIGLAASRPMTELALRSLEQAAWVASLEYHRERIEEQTESELGEELLERLLRPQADGRLVARLSARGYPPDARCRFVIIRVADSRGQKASVEHLRPLLVQHAQPERYRPLIRSQNGCLAALLLATSDTGSDRTRLERLQRRISRYLPGRRVWLGASRPTHPLGGLAEGQEQADLALDLAHQRAPGGAALCAEDLGLDGLLLELAKSSRANDYADELLGPLFSYDKSKGRTLLRTTLETYLEEDCDTQRTADRLYLHPNTVWYRLKLAERLTGRDFTCHEDRCAFHVALRLTTLSPKGIGASHEGDGAG
jgi:PucR family transcriptional regulator, purine catabolism regulatory protein